MEKRENKMSWLKVMVLIFIVAKIWEQVDWSWWIVFIPFYVEYILEVILRIVETYGKRKTEQAEY